MPQATFVQVSRPASSLLASAGIDITPLVGTLHHLVATSSRRRLITVHGDRGDVHGEVFGSDLGLVWPH
ncbi:MAG TPA: hypothetical protein VGP03_11115 [Pseudonocardiaceae bacterium]|nr:hypothetical protein [Pseudonocardiaceae bacterium]